VNVCVVGRGKVGRALYRALREADVDCTLVRGRGTRQPRSGFRTYLLAVPDARIHALAEQLAPALDRRTRVLHCAGARGVEELAALRQRGIAVAVFHPLVSFANTKQTSLHGATFTSLGDTRATTEAKRLARLLGARCIVLPAMSAHEQARYHAVAALVANGATALADVGVRILCELGYRKRDAERALAGLLTSVAANIASVGVPAALTGPVVRGDTETVARHLTALARVDRSASRAYAALQPVVVASARARGLAAKDARAILRTSRAYTEE
jgi:predicted short-subunit dehydrogenase-like oxidoreductase (DUF2520 family)